MEFWQGGENRLHDRFIYQRLANDEAKDASPQWQIDRLAP